MIRFIRTVSTRTVLLTDAGACLAMGAGLIALRNTLSGPTGLGAAFLAGTGAVLLPVGLFILAVAARRIPARLGLPVIVAGNIAWAATSLVLPAIGAISLTPLGLALVIAQAAGVALLAALEARTLRAAALA